MIISKINVEHLLPISETKGEPVMVDGWLRSKTDPDAMITEHFAVKEHQCKCGRCEEQRCDPRLYPALEWIREAIERPIKINSGYRCNGHNRDVGSKSTSQHPLGTAVDIAVPSKDEGQAIAFLAMSMGFRGFGIYSNFLHLDMRNRDTLAVWGEPTHPDFKSDLVRHFAMDSLINERVT